MRIPQGLYDNRGDKPDFVAPAVDVYGPGLLGNFITFTGTSAAAAITAGACAQIMQWRSWIRTIQSCRILPSKIC